MCGIAGIIDWTQNSPRADVLKAMTDRLQHRGPDGEGHHLHANVGLGHRRLSIIDLGTGQQPMTNEDGTVWVTYNGEIYNYQDLRQELLRAGHKFRTQSDTEVVVHGFEEWGQALVPKLRGIFAFAVYNQVSGDLLLARDHFGVKPLVYFESEQRVVFGSEIKALMADPEVRGELDREALADYFEYGYVPAPRTIYRNIHKLMPGHSVLLNVKRRAKLAQQRYWKLDYSAGAADISEREAVTELTRLLDESVRGQMMSDVPLGAMLSGGIDSSAVVAMMARASKDPINTFSIGFDDERFTETQYARKVAQQYHTRHHEHVVTADIGSLLPRLVYHFDEPFADASAVPTYYLCEMARRHVTVALSGDGGDELFAGYDRYRQCMAPAGLDGLPQGLRSLVFGTLARVWPRALPGSGFVRAARHGRDERFVEYMRAQYGALQTGVLFNSQLAAALPPRAGFEYLRASFEPRTADTLHRYLEVDAATYLPNDILAKVDITSMMNSLEVRVPLLDHKLAEYVVRLPSTLKLRGGVTKYIFKKTLEPLLPHEILYRGKMGFGVPMRRWVTTQLRDVVRGYLLDNSRVSGLLDPQLLRTMVEDNERNLYASRYGGKLWWVLFFEMWHRDVYGKGSTG